MSKNQQKYNARMNRDSYMPPTHGYNPFSKNNTTEMDTLKTYYEAMPEDWQKSEMAKTLNPSLSKANVLLDVGKNEQYKPGYEDVDLSDEENSSIFSKIFTPDLLKSALGNVGGNAVNAGFNFLLQENQLDNQKQLQNAAAQKNADAVRNQAQLQVEGMKAAGLNPAGVNGVGAPSVQAGAAAGANSTMGNVFGGIAELIAAAKAPSEIEKIMAETMATNATTEKTEAETTEINTATIPNIQQSTKKLMEETQNIKNANDVFKAHDDFLRDTSAGIWDGYRAQQKASGQWDNLPERTKNTINSLADGEIEMGVGEIQGLNDVINSQANLSNRDRELYDNILRMTITRNQLNDKDVIEALTKLPDDQRKELYGRISKMAAEAYKAMMSGQLDNFHRENEELNAPLWLADNAKERELSNYTNREALQNLWELFKGLTNAVPALAGYAVGRGGTGGNTPPSPLGDKPQGVNNKEWKNMQKQYKQNKVGNYW